MIAEPVTAVGHEQNGIARDSYSKKRIGGGGAYRLAPEQEASPGERSSICPGAKLTILMGNTIRV